MEDAGLSFCCTACVQVGIFFTPYFVLDGEPLHIEIFTILCSVPDSCGDQGEGRQCQVKRKKYKYWGKLNSSKLNSNLQTMLTSIYHLHLCQQRTSNICLHLNFDVIFTDHVNQKLSLILLSNTSSKFTFI